MTTTLLITMLLVPIAAAVLAGGAALGRRGATGAGLAAALAPLVTAGAAIGVLLAQSGDALRLTGPSWIAFEGFASALSVSARPLMLVFCACTALAAAPVMAYGLAARRTPREALPMLAIANLGLFFLLLLSCSESLLLLYVGWHGLGACASLIVGSLRGAEADAREGLGAFLVHRIGDLALLVGIILLHRALGTVDIEAMRDLIAQGAPALEQGSGVFGISRGTAIGICLLIAAAVKSAQVPAQLWLERAAGARPAGSAFVQALAAAAGVLLVVRLDFLFAAQPTAAILATLIGAGGAVLAAAAALTQWDLGRIVVWTSSSQLGFALVAASLGKGGIAVAHLVVHALAKTGLVLAAANVTRALQGERDVRAMGGLARRMPTTTAATLLAVLVLAGAPPLGGFVTQTRVLLAAVDSGLGHGWFLWLLLSLAAFALACALGRLFIVVFTGSCRASDDVKARIREAPGALAIAPAAAAAAGGLTIVFVLPGPWRAWFADAAAGAAPVSGAPIEWAIALMSAMIAVAGVFVAYLFFFKDPELADAVENRYPELAGLLRQGYRLEAFWDRVLARPLEDLGERGFAEALDRRVATRAMDKLAAVPRVLGERLADAEGGKVRGYVAAAIAGLLLVLMTLFA